MTVPISFVIVVTDGRTIRTLHPPSMGRHLPDVDRIVRDLIFPPDDAAPASEPVAPKPPSPQSAATMTQAEIARVQGFTGDVCRQCGSFATKRTGTCLTCTACGSNEGCG
jgi:hypothetical protein